MTDKIRDREEIEEELVSLFKAHGRATNTHWQNAHRLYDEISNKAIAEHIEATNNKTMKYKSDSSLRDELKSFGMDDDLIDETIKDIHYMKFSVSVPPTIVSIYVNGIVRIIYLMEIG